MTLNPKQKAFADEYLKDLNATDAYIRAGYKTTRLGADASGARLLANVSVRKYIDEAMKRRQERTEIDQDRIIRELWNVVTADANELVELRRTCCRYCHGKGFKYQSTAGELESARMAHNAQVLKMIEEGKEVPEHLAVFNERGGDGYDPRKDPHEKCPECFGAGVPDVHAKDTRKLSAAARSLYAGVKQTRDGTEIKMHDKQGFIQLLMRHQGMLQDKVAHHVSSPTGGPVETVNLNVSDSDAAAAYLKMIGGK